MPQPSPRKPHEFQRGRGRPPADGNPKCACGKRKKDPIHVVRTVYFPPEPEPLEHMLKRHEQCREAVRKREEARRSRNQLEAEQTESTMAFLDLDEELGNYEQ
jgi:hypothetical protein